MNNENMVQSGPQMVALMPMQQRYGGAVDAGRGCDPSQDLIRAYQYQTALMNEKSMMDIQTYNTKQCLDQVYLKQALEMKADIQLKKEMLSEELEILDGEIVRKQEFFHEASKQYEFTNFKIIGQPIYYFIKDRSCAILQVKIRTNEQEEKILFFDLEQEETSYYKKKFRNNGLRVKQKRKERGDIILNIMQLLIEKAGKVELPQVRGFYLDEKNEWKYVGKDDMIWKEVLIYAK